MCVLAATAFAVPAAAADTQGTLAIVNGIPGKRLDVCLNGREIRSGLRYGRAVLRDVVKTGDKKLRFYAPDPRTCRGQLVATHDFPLGAGQDLTIVVTKKAPRIVIFDNAGYGEIPPAGDPAIVGVILSRHASELFANFFIRYWDPTDETPISPSVFPLWGKGQEVFSTTFTDWIWQLRVTLPEDPDTIAIKKVTADVSRRYEFILLGTRPANARIVLLDRAISQASP